MSVYVDNLNIVGTTESIVWMKEQINSQFDYKLTGYTKFLLSLQVTHNKKMQPRYLGPLVVISHNREGTYILCKLDGSVLHQLVATFYLVPYLARESIPIPTNTFNIDTNHLRILEETDLLDNEDNMDSHDKEMLDGFDED